MDEYEAKKGFEELLEKMNAIEQAVALMYCDSSTIEPKKAGEETSKVIAILQTEFFKSLVSEQMKQYLEVLKNNIDEMDEITKKVIKRINKEYEKYAKIPSTEYREYRELTAKSEKAWADAKENSDYNLAKPYLEKIFEYNKRFVKYRGYEGHPYNTLLDDYEPDSTVEKLDGVFDGLKIKLVTLIRKIQASNKQINTKFTEGHYDIEKQRQLSKYVLEIIGYDFDAGVVTESAHPYTMDINKNNVRIASRFFENEITAGLYASIHEGGHARYEQNVDDAISKTALRGGVIMAIHESQARMYENMFGRDINFIKFIFPKLQELFPKQIENISAEEIYESVNQVKATFIRIESDELTYSLHIMLRYELERMVLEEKIGVEDLNNIWNQKMEEYLGIIPPNDKLGVLQDVHWYDGSIGYFPSYLLGNIIAAQLVNTMSKEIDIEESLLQGDFSKINEWLKENVHQYGKSKTPEEIIKDSTGEGINPKYYVEYLEKKYGKLYD
ncbi:MAG TPA: carboxypeptidase M32, partial [Clostridiales bacterium]|nr:carboxypeptidase M32 [Clostridiales bacterium]